MKFVISEKISPKSSINPDRGARHFHTFSDLPVFGAVFLEHRGVNLILHKWDTKEN